MRSSLLLAIASLIVLGFIAYWSTYTVRFTEVAVLTTFGKAGENSVRREPGPYLKWPYPIQSVTTYDTRARYLATRSETQQTADDRQIIVEGFLAWRVSDPLAFYQRYSAAGPDARDHFRAAERILESLLRAAMSEVSRFQLRELFDPAPGGSRLGELERAVFDRLSMPDPATGQRMSDYGVEPVLIGVKRIVLPEDTTRQVFERMKATRDRLSAEAESQGQAIASTIRNQAQADAQRIRAFAQRRAEEIRVAGDREAARYLASFEEQPELAVFLKNIEFLRNGLGKKSTLVLPTTMPGMELFNPNAIDDSGRIPVSASPAPQERAAP
ncbi:MAG: hypothetical protein IBJ10_09185 [Phycisphaerales bacterium]|nr:hypothetical protein [Phycisphaerales bacterium]